VEAEKQNLLQEKNTITAQIQKIEEDRKAVATQLREAEVDLTEKRRLYQVFI
jgi:hypothetical protein